MLKMNDNTSFNNLHVSVAPLNFDVIFFLREKKVTSQYQRAASVSVLARVSPSFKILELW